MNSISYIRKNPLALLFIAAFATRFIFIVFFAKDYFNRENIFFDGDFSAWSQSFQNFLEHGIYSYDLSNSWGYFSRMPGYSFFIGIFYLITGDWQTALPLIGWTQTLLDCLAVVLLYRIGETLFSSKKAALILALIYAFYPFIIIWNPVAYSESAAIFFMILFIYLVLRERPFFIFLAGLSLSMAIHCRPQILLMAPLTLLLFVKHFSYKGIQFKKAVIFSFAIILFYGWWPARNYIIYNKFELTQNLRGFETAGDDWIAFCKYIYSVKTGFEPQFTQIITNQPVEIPPIAYSIPGDSVLLEKTIYLAKNCGSSFSNWEGYWKKPFDTPNCNEEIKKAFDLLLIHQKKYHPYHYYVALPIQNLSKAIFKMNLSDSERAIRKLASLLFIYRTFLIFAGIAGLTLMLRNKSYNRFTLVILMYFITLYLLLCAGTGEQFRNIEIRYFLPADVLLLIPASYLFYFLHERYILKRKIQPVNSN